MSYGNVQQKSQIIAGPCKSRTAWRRLRSAVELRVAVSTSLYEFTIMECTQITGLHVWEYCWIYNRTHCKKQKNNKYLNFYRSMVICHKIIQVVVVQQIGCTRFYQWSPWQKPRGTCWWHFFVLNMSGWDLYVDNTLLSIDWEFVT